MAANSDKSVFILYRSFNVTNEMINQMIYPVYKLLQANNIDVFCTIVDLNKYKDQKYTIKQITDESFSHIQTKDIILCLADDDKYSFGMLLEIGCALAHKKEVIMCVRNGCRVDTLDQMVDKTLTYRDYNELLDKIKRLFSL